MPDYLLLKGFACGVPFQHACPWHVQSCFHFIQQMHGFWGAVMTATTLGEAKQKLTCLWQIVLPLFILLQGQRCSSLV